MKNNLNYFECFVGPFCKKNCLFCNEWGFGKREFVSISQFREIIDMNNFEKVVLTWWEPLLNKDIFKYISYCSERNITVSLVTAVIGELDILFFQSMVDYWLSEIMISLEGPSSIHDYLVQEEGAFKNIMKSLVYLWNINRKSLKVMIHTNINKVNYKYISTFCSSILWKFPFIHTYHFQMLEPHGSAFDNSKILFDKYSVLIQPLFSCISEIRSNSKIKFWRLPLCLVEEKYHRFISQTPRIFEQDKLSINEAGYLGMKHENRLCSSCSKLSQCDMFFTHYIDMFWTKEIQPYV